MRRTFSHLRDIVREFFANIVRGGKLEKAREQDVGIQAEQQTADAPQPKLQAKPRVISEKRKEALRLAKLRGDISEGAVGIIDRFSALSLNGWESSASRDKTEAQEVLNEMMNCDYLHTKFTDEMPGGSKWRAIAPLADDVREFADAIWPVDISFVYRRNNLHLTHAKTDDTAPGYEFIRYRTMDAKKLRGKIKLVPARIIEILVLGLRDNGEWYAFREPYGLMGNSWKLLDAGMAHSRISSIDPAGDINRVKAPEGFDESPGITLALSSALSMRYQWHAALGLKQGGPRLLLPTNPSGALLMFKNRERSEKWRRSALRHWVGHHFRDSEEAGLTYVRDHLRGKTEFMWYGLACQLMVSTFDLEKNDFFRLEAEKWRRQRKHNTAVRFRLKKAPVQQVST